MDQDKYLNILKKITPVDEYLNQKQLVTKRLHQTNRKIKSVVLKNRFLREVVANNHTGHKLEQSVFHLLKNIEIFDKVVWLNRKIISPKKGSKKSNKENGIEDIRLLFDKTLIVVDVTAKEDATPKANHIYKLRNFIFNQQNSPKFIQYNVRGLLILNSEHLSNKSYQDRTLNPFTNENLTNEFIIHNKTAAITTHKLVDLYVEYKSGNINKDQILHLLTKGGVIT